MPADKKIIFRKYYLQKRLAGIVRVVSTKCTIYISVEEKSLTKLQIKQIEALRKEFNYTIQFELAIGQNKPDKPEKKEKVKQPKQLKFF